MTNVVWHWQQWIGHLYQPYESKRVTSLFAFILGIFNMWVLHTLGVW